MSNSHKETFASLTQRIREGYQKSGLTVVQFAQAAHCSTSTVYEWTHPEKFNPPNLSDGRKRRGTACSLIRLLTAIGAQDIPSCLESVGLEKYSYQIERVSKNVKQAVAENQQKRAFAEILELPMTDDDWEFLERMKKEFGKDITVGFMLELLQRRKLRT